MRCAAGLRALAHRLDPSLSAYRVPITTPAPWQPTCVMCGVHVPDLGPMKTRFVCEACMDPEVEA